MKNRLFSLLTALVLGLGLSTAQAADLECGLCLTEVTEASAKFEITFADGRRETYGCPHCGLIMMTNHEVKDATATDFLRRTTLDAKDAFYLKGTDIGFCCQPHWLSFASREDAEKFAKGFGGKVMDYDEAMAEIRAEAGALSEAAEGHMHHHH